jgi:hypothetical protein
VTELRVTGGLQLVAAVAFVGVGAGLDHRPAAVVISAALGGIVFGVLMYRIGYRRFVDKATATATVLDTATDREPASATWRRQLASTAILVVIEAAVALVFGAPGLVGGLMLGNSGAFFATAHRLARWESDHATELLREPRYRFNGAAGRFGRGRGAMDGRDYFVVAAAG